MSIIKSAVWGESKDIVAISIERIQTFEPPEGYYVATSYGKDSIVIMDLVKRAGVKYDAHFHITSVDPPELIGFARQHKDNVQWHFPKKNMWQIIREHHALPLRNARFCCEELKEIGGDGRLIITGVRAAESPRRAKRRMVESCKKSYSRRFLHAIIDWTDDDLWEYIHGNNLPYCLLYDEGFKRIGCVGCPMAGKGRLKEFERWPGFERLWRRAADEIVAYRKEFGWKRAGNHRVFDTGGDYFKWWMEENRKATDEDQCVLFE